MGPSENEGIHEGIDSIYEVPLAAEITVHTREMSPENSVERIVEKL